MAALFMRERATKGKAGGDVAMVMNVCISLSLRHLVPGDYDKRFLGLLSELTDAPTIPRAFFRKRLSLLQADELQTHLVAEDTRTKMLCATGTLVVENKFIHGCGRVGHLEDVVVRAGLRGHGIGSEIVRRIVAEAFSKGCYKVLVDCDDANVDFYRKCSFEVKDAQMAEYFDQSLNADVNNDEADDPLRRAETAVRKVCSQADFSCMKNKKSGMELRLRLLDGGDYDAGFLDLLAQLTQVGNVNREKYLERLSAIKSRGREHVVVVENLNSSNRKVVACGTLVFEHKFIHSNGAVGHIEDVVVDSSCRGTGLGKALIMSLKKMSMEAGCYKCILNCSETNVAFYEKCGMERRCVSMALYCAEDRQ